LAVLCCYKYIKGVRFIFRLILNSKINLTPFIYLLFNNLENSDVLSGLADIANSY